MDATEIPITKGIRSRRRQRSWRRIARSVAAVSGILLLLNLWLMVSIFCSRQQEVVTFDMQGTVNSFMAQLSHQHPGEETVKKPRAVSVPRSTAHSLTGNDITT